jgi:hypothetical protein
MIIEFNVEPYQGCMNVKIAYEREEIKQNSFYLNRDFLITEFRADEIKYDIVNGSEMEPVDEFDGYEAKKYFIPTFNKQLAIEYKGILTGKTGCCPYVRETISPEFILLRWETFCYPIFINENMTFRQFLGTRLHIDVTVLIPDEFTSVTCMPELSNHMENGVRTQKFWSDRHGIAIAIAKYRIKELSVGKFYLLNEIDSINLEKTMIAAHNFMNAHFGARDISKSTNYVAIPNNYGSFVTFITVFVEEATFESVKTMNQIIHEFTHLGWNAKTDDETQKIRFFDEAFSSYFEMRVMEHLTGENYKLAELIDHYKYQLNDYDGDVPIIDFGKHGYGDLSYTIGAICLYELSKFVGVEVFEEATKIFLHKYIDTPVNIETFCNEYIHLCDKPGLEQFFKDWIYSAAGPKVFIASNNTGKIRGNLILSGMESNSFTSAIL